MNTSATFSRNQRLKIALGGFMSFTGFLILAIVILTATGSTDVQSVHQNQLTLGAMVTLGVLDVFCWVLLNFQERKFRWLIPAHKKKPDDNVD